MVVRLIGAKFQLKTAFEILVAESKEPISCIILRYRILLSLVCCKPSKYSANSVVYEIVEVIPQIEACALVLKDKCCSQMFASSASDRRGPSTRSGHHLTSFAARLPDGVDRPNTCKSSLKKSPMCSGHAPSTTRTFFIEVKFFEIYKNVGACTGSNTLAKIHLPIRTSEADVSFWNKCSVVRRKHALSVPGLFQYSLNK